MKIHCATNVTEKDETLIVLVDQTQVLSKHASILKSSIYDQINGPFEYVSSKNIFSGKLNESVVFRSLPSTQTKTIIFVGVASSEISRSEQFRRAGANVTAILSREKLATASVYFSGDIQVGIVQYFIEGLLLSTYRFNDFKSAADKNFLEPQHISILHDPARPIDQEVKSATLFAEATNFARHLGDLPPSDLTPSRFASIAKKESQNLSVEFEEWKPDRLKAEKMRGLISVGRGSSEEPRMIILKYNGADKSQKPLCLVGKGITFDSGGLDLKSSKNIEDMRYDMCGAAAVVCATLAIARLQLPINVITFAALTENMPGPNAVKPGDIYFARNGTSIEVMNTDAEGRLILADALCLAVEANPSAIIDVATLTGGVIAALGNVHSGLFTQSEKLFEQIQSASIETGESVWRLPLADEYSKDMKGQFADLTNMSISSGASSATAAAFLNHFVPKEIPWVHLDIAGTAQHMGERLPYLSKKGASGVMVRTLIQFARNFV